jgi:hypothetical protein
MNSMWVMGRTVLEPPAMREHEYAFRVKLDAVVRVRATDEANARIAIPAILALATLRSYEAAGMNARIIDIDFAIGTTTLFEIDGRGIPAKPRRR